MDKARVQHLVQEYRSFHAGSVETRKSNYAAMVNNYYDLATAFYEYGWGESFHFAPRRRGESFTESLARHQHFLARELGLRPGMEVLDVGCGIGGPMREIAHFSGAQIVGVNNNEYQIERGRVRTRETKLDNLCTLLKADFMNLPVRDGRFDAIYAIEATCHAPDKQALFAELHRVLKPGGHFAGYDWCLTDRYDARDPQHRAIKKIIEEGDALPDIAFAHQVVEPLKRAGFEVLASRDLALESDPETPWYLPLAEKWSVRGFPRSQAGRWFTHRAVTLGERIGVAPKGSAIVSELLNRAATALVQSGQIGMFTPMFYFHVRKPE